MSNPIEEDGRVQGPEQPEGGCGPSCSCNTADTNKKAKIAVCVFVALAAVAVVALNSTGKPTAASSSDAFSMPSAAQSAAPATAEPAAKPAVQSTAVWGPTLSSVASLNQVAGETKAVFVFVPAKDGKQTSAIESRVESAAKQARSRGTAVTAFMLSSDAEDYAGITKQVPAPCVLAMVKGAGSTPVTGEITEAKLLAALVTASRPSSCGPSGCGPAGCN